MNILGIDLSMRSTGCCLIINDVANFILIQPSDKEYTEEKLLIHISKEILTWIDSFSIIPDYINIEGLSLNSQSNSKDILYGNFWHLRCNLYQKYPNVNINVIPVQSWRSPLFNKEERKEIKEADKKVKELKKEIKNLKKLEKSKILLDNEDIIYKANIKYQTFLKLPSDVSKTITDINKHDGKYDLTDSYFITKFVKK